MKRPLPTAILAAFLSVGPALAGAHEIPRDVTIRAFVRPTGTSLAFLVRVPLEALRDVQFPKRSDGFLDLERAEPLLRGAAVQWISGYVKLYENGELLTAPELTALKVSLPTDRSFGSFETAMAHVSSGIQNDSLDVEWRQAVLDVAFQYPITSDQSRFSIDPALAHLGIRTLTILWFEPPGKSRQAFEYTGNPGLVRLDPRWDQAVARFVGLGFGHILDGLDHLLFLLCLMIPARTLVGLVPVVTSFTVAHSITLIASALGLAPGGLWFPPLIEALIAVSIVYMAIENGIGARVRHRWAVAFGFGLVHGFGFSFALRDSLQFAGSHLLTSLLSFNLGVELGQLFVVILAVPILRWIFRRVPERAGTIVLSLLVGHTAWHWLTDRVDQLSSYRFEWPAMSPILVAQAMRWAALILLIGGAAWLLRLGIDRFGRRFGRLGVGSADSLEVS